MKKSNTALAVAAGCVVLILVLWRFSQLGRTVIIKVETIVSQSSVLGMQRIIQAQKMTIDLYTNRPKVVYKCLDDEPSVKYPKRASDDYTTVLMGTDDDCGNTTGLDAVIIVHTAAGNFDKRFRFRKVYADRNLTWPYKLKVVFLLGRVLDAELQLNLELENRQYGDTVQGNFLDTYQNLTLKATMGYRWVSEMCAPGYKILLKMDDDVIFDVHRFFGDYLHPLPEDKKKQRLFCQVWKNAAVSRTGKWRVPKGLFSNASYSFPYCSGFLVGVSPDLVKPMYETAKAIDFFWIDDVFTYGMVPRAIKYLGFTNIGGKRGGMLTQDFTVYKKCIESKKVECGLIGIVTSDSNQFFQVFNNFPHQVLKVTNITKSAVNTTLPQLKKKG